MQSTLYTPNLSLSLKLSLFLIQSRSFSNYLSHVKKKYLKDPAVVFQ